MNIIDKIKNYFKPKYITIYIPKKFSNNKKRNRCLIETKKHILNITKIDI
jgi:hypothetical protein